MRNRHRRMGFAMVGLILLLLACIQVDLGGEQPLPTPPPPTSTPVATEQPVQVDVRARYYAQVPTAFYHLLGKTAKQQNLAEFTLTNQGSNAVTIKLTSWIEGFTDQAVDTIQLDGGQTTRIEQTPVMQMGVRNQLNEAQVAAWHYKLVYLQGGQEKLLKEQSAQVQMMSKRDLVVVIVDDNGNLVADFREYVAAWVTPASPEVEQLLRDATQYIPGEAIYGYQGGAEGVLPQLEAIYRVINDQYSVRYVSTPVSLSSTEKTFVQRIRLPAETVRQQAGNCIETTLLYASAIEAMDMNPLLVLVPGHAFVACETDRGSHQYIFIETTVLGQGMTFADALAAGQKNWQKYQSQSMLIDVRHWQARGITPMPED